MDGGYLGGLDHEIAKITRYRNKNEVIIKLSLLRYCGFRFSSVCLRNNVWGIWHLNTGGP